MKDSLLKARQISVFPIPEITTWLTGADLELSRGRDFQKKNYVSSIFFWLNQIDFPSSPRAIKRLCVGHVFYASGKISKKKEKNGPKKGILENFDQKNCTFSARSPLILLFHFLLENLVN